RNIAAAHSYNAVPFMLTVAPSGKTKLEILFDTPAFFSTQSIVTGRVADDDAVENAVSMAGAIAGKIRYGLPTRPNTLRNRGSVIVACSISPASVASANVASGPAALNPVSATTAATRPKTPIGANSMIHSVMRIITLNTPSQNLYIG